ncbi:MAG: hypothetical protein RLZZ292_1222 [Bacteroidota bacterium]
MINTPTHHHEAILNYTRRKYTFLVGVLPEEAVQLSGEAVLQLLTQKYGSRLQTALKPSESVASPVAYQRDTLWLKRTNMVGINVRTIGNFWNVVKYAMTLPLHQSAIHLLPIWECGVVNSLYGMASWNINSEFYSAELATLQPQLDTVEKQLKVVTNILHLLGKTVGLDVIPHTDRYAEIALSNPHLYEWLQRKDLVITQHQSDLYLDVQRHITDFLFQFKSADGSVFLEKNKITFWQLTENQRIEILFGQKKELIARNNRRNQLVQWLYDVGYEPVPATMGPPYRGLYVDTSEMAKTIDSEGRVWRDFLIAKPTNFTRVFGPLGKYKLYEPLNQNVDWELDFNAPFLPTFEYVAAHYEEVVTTYNFDFMRGDMAHVQLRAEGVPSKANIYYDIHKYIKQQITKKRTYFGYYAESFLAPDDKMAFGSEPDHLDLSDADSALGDLQSLVVGSPSFLQTFRYYLDLLATRSFSPCFTIMTADKDDPRFDAFYVKGNEARLFIGLFLTDMPSYVGLGFECRDTHLAPAPNEKYTKLYVFQLSEGEKATHGAYQWGKNEALFQNLTNIHLYAEQILSKIPNSTTHWLLLPDATGNQKVIAWTQKDNPRYIFVVNLDIENAASNVKIPNFARRPMRLLEDFSTLGALDEKKYLEFNGKSYQLPVLEAGVGMAFTAAPYRFQVELKTPNN